MRSLLKLDIEMIIWPVMISILINPRKKLHVDPVLAFAFSQILIQLNIHGYTQVIFFSRLLLPRMMIFLIACGSFTMKSSR